MNSIPQPKALTSNFAATWDAWNRLVSLSDGSNLVAEHEYDPVNRRIVVTNYDFSTDPETVEVRHRYHTTSWQVIEERVDSSEDAAQQFVWNVGFIDDLLVRDRDTNGDGSLDERLYALTDLRYSVMALANTSGTIVERFRYEAHGRSTALNADFAPRAESFYDWEYRYTGREFDLQTGLYHFRNRYYHADLGRFISRDPIGYVDGMSLYSNAMHLSKVDPLGLCVTDDCPRFSGKCWISGKFADLEASNLRMAGEYQNPDLHAIPGKLFARWFYSFDLKGTAKVEDTVTCCDGKKIAIEVSVPFDVTIAGLGGYAIQNVLPWKWKYAISLKNLIGGYFSIMEKKKILESLWHESTLKYMCESGLKEMKFSLPRVSFRQSWPQGFHPASNYSLSGPFGVSDISTTIQICDPYKYIQYPTGNSPSDWDQQMPHPTPVYKPPYEPYGNGGTVW